MRKICASVLLVALLVSAAGAYALFNDTEEAGQNVLTAGTLDLTVNGQNPYTGSFTVDKMKPGDTKYALFTLKNIGNLNGILDIRITNRVNLENGLMQPEIDAGDTGEPGELGDQCKLKIWHDINRNGKYDSGEYTWPAWGSSMILNEIPENFNLFAAYTMVAGSEHPIMFRIQFKNLGIVNNKAMGDSIVFDILFTLTQA